MAGRSAVLALLGSDMGGITLTSEPSPGGRFGSATRGGERGRGDHGKHRQHMHPHSDRGCGPVTVLSRKQPERGAAADCSRIAGQ